jgi:molybdopterin-guanine dinucleotide biosynthesis protein A
MSELRAAAFVLCGGASRRMGRDKSTLPFGDETLLERVVRLVSSRVDEVWLVAREGQRLPDLGLPVARDPADGLGPLAGVVAGLRAIAAERAFAIACDTPLLEPDLVPHLLALSRGHRAAIPFARGFYVPTAAVYAKSILPAAEALLARGELRPRLLASEPGVRTVSEEEIAAVDPQLHSLRDCDTPEEYRALLELAGLAAQATRAC